MGCLYQIFQLLYVPNFLRQPDTSHAFWLHLPGAYPASPRMPRHPSALDLLHQQQQVHMYLGLCVIRL